MVTIENENVGSFAGCKTLLDFIKHFDIEMAKDIDNIELKLLFARIIIKIGEALRQSEAGLKETQEKTLLSANEFLINSSDGNWDAFCQSSTNSYPFGPGDGCYCVAETGISDCLPGSGCVSGIGCLAFIEMPADEVWVIIEEMIRKIDSDYKIEWI